MKSFQMFKVTPFACAAVMMMAAAACTNASETEVDEEGDRVATDQQELTTDGQVCINVQRGTSGQVEDATLWQSAPIWTDDINERLKTGNSPDGGYARSLIRFDLSAVPAGATVVSADLTLTQVYKEGPDATTDVLRSTGAWSEGTVTWDSFGGAFDPTPVASFTAVGDGGAGARTVTVRALAQSWVSNAAANHGVGLDAPTDMTPTEFRSSESPYVDQRPALALCYTTCDDGVQNGEETGVDCGGSRCNACGGSFTYSAIYTNSATVNTTNVPISLSGGTTVALGTCGLPGAWGLGDTYIRLYGPFGTQVAVNDDNCGNLSTYLTYTVPANAGGTYVIRAGCFAAANCSGNVVYTMY